MSGLNAGAKAAGPEQLAQDRKAINRNQNKMVQEF